MGKRLSYLIYTLIIIFAISAAIHIHNLAIAQTPLGTTEVWMALEGDLNGEGKWNQITWADSSGPTTTHPLAGAPTDATYITQTADGDLSNEQAMGALSTGIVKNTTTTGVQSIAVAGTDYSLPVGWTDSNPHVTVTDVSDNVGIGTNTVGSKLQVDVPTATKTGLILKTTDDSTTNNLMEFHDSAGAVVGGFNHAASVEATTFALGAAPLANRGFYMSSNNHLLASIRQTVNIDNGIGILDEIQTGRGTKSSPTASLSGDIIHSKNWMGYGTSFAVGAAQIIETTENWSGSAQGTKMTFYTVDNTTTTLDERMVIDHNGNIGIGTSTPSVALDVWDDSATDAVISVHSGDHTEPNDYLRHSHDQTNPTIDYGNGSLQIQGITDSTTGVQILDSDGGTPIFNVDTTNERVGIGTVSPLSKLNVKGSGGSEVRIIVQTGGTGSEDVADFSFYDSSDAVHGVFRYVGSGASDYAGANSINFIQVQAFPLAFGTNNTVNMLLDGSGRLGINTTSPNSLLDVQGAAGADGRLTLSTAELTVVDGNKLGQIDWQAPLESSGTDAILVGASIWAEADADFNVGTNTTDLVFATANSETAAEKMRLSSSNLSMANDVLILHDTNSGLTASTTQTQGQGAMTAEINQFSTVANNNDTSTMPAALTGLVITIINDGANTLQIFPASGDNLGSGVDLAQELEPNEDIVYSAYNDDDWSTVSSTEIKHAEMHDEDNTDAFVINDTGADFHSYHSNGVASGDLANWSFDIGGGGTSFPIASVADGAASGTDIAVTTTGSHGLAVGDIVSQTNLAIAVYVGIFEVKAIISPTVYEVAAVFDADATGTMDQASVLIAGVDSSGVYSLLYFISATSATNNETFDFQLYREATAIVGTKVRRKFGTAADFGSMSGGGVVAITDGDKISLALSNEDTAGNVTIRNFTLILTRL